MITFRRIVRSLVRRPRYSIGFLLAGILGLSGNLYLSSLEGSIRSSLAGRSRELLTGDLSIAVRRLTTDEDRAQIDAFLAPVAVERTRSLDLYSMLSTGGASRLTELVAIEENYPLIGRLKLEGAGWVSGSTPKPTLGSGQIWIDPDVRDSLALEPGAAVSIGDRKFTVSDIILDDTASTWRGFTLAPRIMMTLDDLWTTGLIRKGSTVWDRTYIRLRPGADSRAEAIRWNDGSTDPAIRAKPHEEASEQVAKLTARLNDYLGLVGLTTLFLAIVGISFLFQTELRKRLRMIGTLRALGDSNARISREIAGEASLLGAIAGLGSLGIVALTLPFAAKFVERISNTQIAPRISIFSAIFTVVLGAVIGAMIAIPFAARTGRLKPGLLFQDEANLEIPSRPGDGLRFLPLAALFYGLSAYHSHSWKVGSLFFALSAMAVFGLYFVGKIFFVRLARLRTANLPLRLAIRSLARNPWSSLSGFVAVGIGALLLSLIPALQSIIESEIERPEGSRVPSLFLFDIQEEQLAKLESTVAGLGGALDFKSPMIRARLESIRGEPVVKALEFAERSTREQEEEERNRNRGFNLSYRDSLADSESIVKGRNFAGPYDPSSGKPAEATLENKFADRLGVTVGDRLAFDVQGVPVEALVVGLRRVRWSSFQPNFFVLFQPGVLEDAPKTYLAGIPSVGASKRKQIQESVVAGFPNVSVIQVEEMVRKIVRMFDQMGAAVRLTALLSLATGIFVLFAIARRQAELRRRSALLLKTVGASSREVFSIFLWEFGILSFVAALFGVGFSFVIARILAIVVFDRADGGASLMGIAVIAIIVLVSLVSVTLASMGMIREKPWRLLQAEGDR